MKRILKYISTTILFCILVGLITNFVLTFSSNINNNIVLSNDKSNLEQIKSTGDLVSNKDLESLEDSGITGEDSTINTTFYPYYNLLSTNEQTLYKQVYANIENLSTTFVPRTSIDTSSVVKTIEAVFNDHPEFFWLDISYSYKYTQDGNCVQIILNFNETVNNFSESKSLFEKSAQTIIDGAKGLETNYEKEKYVHDTLIQLVSYDTNSTLNQSAYSALVNKASVCAGYARAFQYIMIKLGIPTYYVTGTAGESHAWNIVKLSDGYYNVDVTWDDESTGIYDYFNVVDSIFSKTHTRTGLSVSLPSCTATTYSGLEKNSNVNNSNSNEVAPDNQDDASINDESSNNIEENIIDDDNLSIIDEIPKDNTPPQRGNVYKRKDIPVIVDSETSESEANPT